MILVWNNITTFRRHLEEMKTFRQSHENTKVTGLNGLNEITVPLDIVRSDDLVPLNPISDHNGRRIIVPIWQINLDRGTQN